MSSRRRSGNRFRPNAIPPGPWRWHSRDLLESPAWAALNLAARQCLDRIDIELMAHGGRGNGHLIVTFRDFANYGVSPKSVEVALTTLVALGFIEMIPGHASPNPEYGRAMRFRLLSRAGVDGPPLEERWRTFTTDIDASAAVARARAEVAERRKSRAKSREKNNNYRASQREALLSAIQKDALKKRTKGSTGPRTKGSTLYNLGEGGLLKPASVNEPATATDAAVQSPCPPDLRSKDHQPALNGHPSRARHVDFRASHEDGQRDYARLKLTGLDKRC